MSPKFGEKSPMATAEVMGVTREMAGELVEREKRATGSLMAAYQNVAKSVGVTPDWIRKFIKGSTEVKEPRTTPWLNIILLHERIVARIDQTAANERAKSAALREKLNEAMGGNLELVERVARTKATGASHATDLQEVAAGQPVATGTANPEAKTGLLTDRALRNGGAA